MKKLLLSFAICSFLQAESVSIRVINGKPVEPSTALQVVKLRIGDAMCTGTVVGERAVLTASHCGQNGSKVIVTYNNQEFFGVFYRHPKYEVEDIDVALIVLTEAIPNVQKVCLSMEQAKPGAVVEMFGYGCTALGGDGPMDMILRKGTSTITHLSNVDYVTEQGGALCFGDSGGPLLNQANELIGIASKGNIQDTSYFHRLEMEVSKSFLVEKAAEHKIEICGLK